MSSIDARSLILQLTSSVPEKSKEGPPKAGDLTEKVNQISTILKENPDLRNDLDIMGKVMDLTKGSKVREVSKFRKELILDVCMKEEKGIMKLHFPQSLSATEKTALLHSCPKEKGRFEEERKVLVFSKEALKKQDSEQLWEFIEKECVKTLVIRQDEGETIEYGEKILEKLIEKENRPPAADLAKKITAEFVDGEIAETKAKLGLCGQLLEGMLEQTEDEESPIDFKNTTVTMKGLEGIVSALETGKYAPEVPIRAYEIACDFLGVPSLLPEGVFGPEDWEQQFGLEVKDVPPIPSRILDRFNQPCPFFSKEEQKVKVKVKDTHVLFLVPKGLTFNKMIELAKEPIMGDPLEAPMIVKDIQEKYGNEEVPDSYWVLMPDKLVPDSAGKPKNREEQLAYVPKQEGYQAPSLLEVGVCCLAMYAKNGALPLSWGYTCCRDEPIQIKHQFGSIIAGKFGRKVTKPGEFEPKLGIYFSR